MKVVDLLEQRRASWRALELMCVKMEGRGRKRLGGAGVAQFAALYRSACADLALADAYSLPANTVLYLHQLVARAHNQLYRSRRFNFAKWGHELFVVVPQQLFRDKFLRISFVLFWGMFIASLLFARSSHEYSERLIGKDQLHEIQEMYSKPMDRQNGELSAAMQGFYSQHNATIGLRCFAMGLLFGFGGMIELIFNAIQLGAIFGFMSTVGEWNNFSTFVTAHGPFELSGVVLAGAAGMRLGFSIINTKGMSRAESLRQAGREATPTMLVMVALFFLAAPIEGFLSPSPVPYGVKVAVAVVSTAALLFYVVVLGSRPLPESEVVPTMQLDNTRIAIRERDLLDVLDLSLQTIREFAVPWFFTSVIGAVPLAVLNWWLLRSTWHHLGVREGWESFFRDGWMYVAMLIVLMAWELPLAGAVATRYFGHALFVDRPPVGQIVRDLRSSLPQLIIFQVMLRGLIFLPVLVMEPVMWLWAIGLFWLPFVVWPYLNEVLLLERNPLMRTKGRMTTWQRSQALHAGSRGTQFGRWLMSLLLAGGLTVGLSASIWYIVGLVSHHSVLNEWLYLYELPAAMWIVASFFAVARYLSYLDMRIRREGWEVELQIRAEADRLARQIG